jgi:hypothetical protein
LPAVVAIGARAFRVEDVAGESVSDAVLHMDVALSQINTPPEGRRIMAPSNDFARCYPRHWS